MILTIDIGNTNITLGVFDEEKLVFTSRLATDTRRTEDQYALELRNIFVLHECSKSEIEGAIISSVVPHVGAMMSRAVEILFGYAPMMLGPGIKTGLNIKIDNPAQLGADLAAGAVAAMTKYPLPCIIFDLGTATTVSVVDREGGFLGGAIAAGPSTTLEALATKTAQLPFIDIEAPKSVIGSNTVDCMKSGIVFGTASMLEGMASRIEKILGEEATLVATGGLAGTIVSKCERKIILDDNLLLDGLRIIYNKNKNCIR
ncbi:MAG: type III pantothenate kinase [Clostridia bacterium]|nr:type III pantothenate kinase [Clostridia bacterium]